MHNRFGPAEPELRGPRNGPNIDPRSSRAVRSAPAQIPNLLRLLTMSFRAARGVSQSWKVPPKSAG
eukprot:5836264-Alexandrium_andersonii.AAC.1